MNGRITQRNRTLWNEKGCLKRAKEKKEREGRAEWPETGEKYRCYEISTELLIQAEYQWVKDLWASGKDVFYCIFCSYMYLQNLNSNSCDPRLVSPLFCMIWWIPRRHWSHGPFAYISCGAASLEDWALEVTVLVEFFKVKEYRHLLRRRI